MHSLDNLWFQLCKTPVLSVTNSWIYPEITGRVVPGADGFASSYSWNLDVTIAALITIWWSINDWLDTETITIFVLAVGCLTNDNDHQWPVLNSAAVPQGQRTVGDSCRVHLKTESHEMMTRASYHPWWESVVDYQFVIHITCCFAGLSFNPHGNG